MKKSGKYQDGKEQKKKPEMTEVEWEIMRIVWDKEPCSAGTVLEELNLGRTSHNGTKNKAYSTVKTTMDRMAEKGFLQIDKVRNLQLFKSCISEIDAKRKEFRKMLKRAFDGALTPMMQFLVEHEDLSKEEISKLREVVKNANKGK